MTDRAPIGSLVARRYRLERELGEGGFGIVYEAHDTRSDTRLAIKVLRRSDPTSLARFKREFRALTSLSHRNVIELYDLVSDGDRWCFSMERVDGVDLRSYVRSSASEHFLAETAVSTRGDSLDGPQDDRGGQEASRDTIRDDVRFFTSFVQLAIGIEALHAHGVLHCDLKPSNVLVARDGRVIIVDFGLAGIERTSSESTRGRHAGTPGYMSPEQLSGSKLGAATDWYAFGVLLFELWSGRSPFEGTSAGIAGATLRHEAPRLSSVRSDTPPELDELCASLLARDASERAGARDVRACLDGLARRVSPASVQSGSTSRPVFGTTRDVFVGRAAELGRLRAAFEAAREGGRVSMFVAGPSGVGKTALVEHFVQEISRHAFVVNNACFAREDIPFKALDGLSEALATAVLHGMPSTLETADLTALARIFPALRSPTTPDSSDSERDPFTLRARAARAGASLLGAAAGERPIVLVVDDVQWSDKDSEAVLRLLFAQTDGVFLVCTWQRAETSSLPMLERLGEDPRTNRCELLELGPLPAAAAEELVSALVTDRPLRRRIVHEATGNPFLLHQLARDAIYPPDALAPIEPSLGSMMDVRLRDLTPRARTLLELLSVAGGPVDEGVATRSIGASDDGPSAVHALVARGFVRISAPQEGERRLTLAHARIGRIVVERLDEHDVRRFHAGLAKAMETDGTASVEALATHWALAGDHSRAAPYAERAAAAAANALAFERAATLYGVAIDHAKTGASLTALRVKRGEALAHAGHGRAAALEYLAAAEASKVAEALDLRRRAAEQLLQSGYVNEGLRTLKRFVRSVGLPAPAKGIWRLPRLAWARLRARRAMARATLQRQDERRRLDLPAARRADVSWAVSTGLGFLDPVAAAEYASRHTAAALGTDDPMRVVRALTSEAIVIVGEGEPAWARVEALVRRAESIAFESGDPLVFAMCDATMGVTAGLSGRFSLSRDRCEAAENAMADRIRTEPWQLATVRHFALYAALVLGDLDVLVRRAPTLFREYSERGNRYGASGAATNYANIAWLLTEGPRVAREVVERAERWFPTRVLTLPHYDAAISHTHLDLFEGRAHAAFDRVEALWKRLRSSLMLSVEPVFVDALFLRLRATVAAARATRGFGREALLARVAVGVRRLERARSRLARPLGALVRAGALAAGGKRASAADQLRTAIVALDAAELPLYGACARSVLAAYVGGAEAAELRSRMGPSLASVSARDIGRFTSIFVPGFDT